VTLEEKLKAWREDLRTFGFKSNGLTTTIVDTDRYQALIDALLIYEDALDSILGQMELVNDHPIEVVLIAREANAKVEELLNGDA
jgi:hypothetical protein